MVPFPKTSFICSICLLSLSIVHLNGCRQRDPFLRSDGTATEDAPVDGSSTIDEGAKAQPEVAANQPKPSTPERPSVEVSPAKAELTLEPWYRPESLDVETWELQYRGNSPIGYSRRQIEIGRVDQTNTVRIEAETKVRIQQNDLDVEQQLTVSTIERPDGELISFEVQMKVGDQFSRVKGKALADQMKLARNEEGRTVNSSLRWNSSFRGPFALVQSLKRKPMKTGEIRQFSYLDPVLVEVVDAKLVAGDPLETAVLDGQVQKLMEVTATLQVRDKKRIDVLWIDEDGDIWKSYTDQLQLRTFRCNRETAMVMKSAGDWESAHKVSLNFRKPLGDPKLIDRMVFQVESRELDPFMNLSTSNQQLKSVTASTCEVIVSAVKSGANSSSKTDKPDPSWIAADPYLQVDEPVVRQWVEALLQEDAKGPAIVRLTKGIFRRLAKNPESKHFANAKQIVEKPEGDSTEHAVLLATAARIQGIPARLVIGMLANGQSQTATQVATEGSVQGRMDLHMWTEVWMGERWIPIDAWTGDAPALPNRIKFREFDLRQDNPYEVMLAAAKLMQQMDVEIKEIEAKTAPSGPEMSIGANGSRKP